MARIVGTENDDRALNGWDAFWQGIGVALGGTSGEDEMFGLGGDDLILGAGGDDYINGGSGEDSMQGGAGDDTYVVDDVDDAVIETSNNGTDTVLTFVTFTLPRDVEVLTLAATAGAIAGNGSVLDNTLNGNDSNNTLNGDAGDDTLFGNGGRDTLFGTDGDDRLFGGAQDDDLRGGGDDDTLDGGAGNDDMDGGSGDDVYWVDSSGDTITDSSGFDTVHSFTTFTLATGVENLILQEFAGAINGTGNASINAMQGNERNNTLNGLGGEDLLVGGEGNDTLNGGDQNDVMYGEEHNDTLNGGSGADSMIGGIGNDSYVVDNFGDRTTELANEGTDTVTASNLLSFTLGANLENLVLVGASLVGIGNGLVNTITGNSLDNRLDGAGGADTLVGQLGNDTYIVDNAGDRVTEFGGQGSDRVETSVSCTLTAGADVEILRTTNSAGTTAINLTGNTSGNAIIGNAGRNTINGGGGRDELTGGEGIDLFLFNSAPDGSNVATITDYSVADDTIVLDDAVFTEVREIGFQIDSDQLVIAAAAQDAEDRIIYNSTTGALSYDADGTGSIEAIQFATLSSGLALQFFDFAIA